MMPSLPISEGDTPDTVTHGKKIPTSSSYFSPGFKIPFENSRTMDECRVEVLRKFRKDICSTVRFCDVSRILISCGLVSKEECFEICKLPVSKQMAQCYQKVHDIMDILVCQKASASLTAAAAAPTNVPEAEKRLGSQRMLAESDKQNGLVKDIWKNFINALKEEHAHLAGKMENELDRSTESRLLLKKSTQRSASTRSLIKKEDIGCPRDFQHVQHYGLLSDKRLAKLAKQHRKQGDGAAAVTTTTTVYMSSPNLPLVSVGELRVPAENGGASKNSPAGTIDLNENDEDLKEFFKRAGVVNRHLLNPLTKQVICRFIAENGGMDAVRDEVRQNNLSAKLDMVSEEYGDLTLTTPNIPSVSTDFGVPAMSEEIKWDNNKNAEIRRRDRHIIDNHNPPQAPVTVPFQPTPRPTSNSFYF